ncbi:MAG TPA: RNA polymerase sigma factor [Kofleriaceae bacterium]|nr:RNA polymerase sigma factor [Kofleriaceae bacterium]
MRLIEPIHGSALAFARGLCRSRADGDDLFQESLLRALDKLDDLREDGAFRFWLHRVIVSVHRNRCRGAFWRRLVPIGDDNRATPPIDDAISGANRARVALASLPAEQREALVLFEIEGWKIDEIAAMHGISESAVKSRLARGRDRLRAFYAKKLGITDPAPILVPEDNL